jgi:hypothetical protein
MAMKCEEVDIRMVDFLDKKIDDKTRREIEMHLETCERCLDELKETQQVLNLISKGEIIKPQESLRINFYQMLHGQILKEEKKIKSSVLTQRIPWYTHGQYRIAAAIALLVCGTFIGLFIHNSMSGVSASNELKQLQNEVTDLKKTALFTMMKEESSSDRIQAVGYAEELDNPDQKIIEVLIKTLNNDKNVNVRMAAAYALSKFTAQRMVIDSLVKSLSIQSDPILQVTLINILAEKKEKSALRPIQEIIANRNTIKEVRTVAENSLRVLI